MPKAAWKQILAVCGLCGFHNLSLLGAGVAFFTFLALTAHRRDRNGLWIGWGRRNRPETDAVHHRAGPARSGRGHRKPVAQRRHGECRSDRAGTRIALGFAVFGGMRAANGLIGALNIINEEHETRGIISLNFRAAALTLAAIFVALTGLISSGMFAWLQMQAGDLLGEAAAFAIKCLTWIASILFGSAGFALIMRYGPDREPARWLWLAPGALVATLLWIAISFGFSFYVAYVSDYNATYGSLSAIVVFLMWLFLSAYGVLGGALLNAEIERQTTVDTTTGLEMPIGERGAVLADLAEGGLSISQWMEKAERRAVRRHLRSHKIRSSFKN